MTVKFLCVIFCQLFPHSRKGTMDSMTRFKMWTEVSKGNWNKKMENRSSQKVQVIRDSVCRQNALSYFCFLLQLWRRGNSWGLIETSPFGFIQCLIWETHRKTILTPVNVDQWATMRALEHLLPWSLNFTNIQFYSVNKYTFHNNFSELTWVPNNQFTEPKKRFEVNDYHWCPQIKIILLKWFLAFAWEWSLSIYETYTILFTSYRPQW